jgi:hypothetical protein
MVFLAFTKDNTLTVDPSVIKAFETKDFTSLKSMIVNDIGQPGYDRVTNQVASASLRGSTLSQGVSDYLDGIAPLKSEPKMAQYFDELTKQAKAVFTVATPPTGPTPSAPPSSATYSASCSKCSVINNQITCACDVLPK